MNLTRTSLIRLLRIVLAVVVILIIVAYAIWRSLNYARGPAIIINSPADGSSIGTETVEITGQALRVNNLTMNGQVVSVDQQGNFDQTVILFHGTNRITFVAGDQFGRSEKKELNLVGTVYLKDLAADAASTTAASSTKTR